jgi:hypothetical protein
MYQALLPLMRTPRLPVVDWTDAPADLNGLVRLAERRNLVSVREPSHLKRSLRHSMQNRKKQGNLSKRDTGCNAASETLDVIPDPKFHHCHLSLPVILCHKTSAATRFLLFVKPRIPSPTAQYWLLASLYFDCPEHSASRVRTSVANIRAVTCRTWARVIQC